MFQLIVFVARRSLNLCIAQTLSGGKLSAVAITLLSIAFRFSDRRWLSYNEGTVEQLPIIPAIIGRLTTVPPSLLTATAARSVL